MWQTLQIMKQSLKAALLSALLIPGAGQIILKRYISGAFYALVALISLSVIVAEVLKLAHGISDHINSDAMQATSSGFIGAVSAGFKVADMTLINTSFVVFLFIWLVSILDAYRVGNQLDKQSTSAFNHSGAHFS